MMSAELSGVLEQVSEIDGYAGQYRGTLWLDLTGVDMANSFDEKFSQIEVIKVMLAATKGLLLDGAGQDQYSETVLSAQLQSDVSVMITAGGGTQTSDVSGKFTPNSEDIVFSFDHHLFNDLSGRRPGDRDINVHEYRSYHLTSTDVDSLTQVTTVYTEFSGPFGYYEIKGAKTPSPAETFPVPWGIGTVWKPLESNPSITVYFGN